MYDILCFMVFSWRDMCGMRGARGGWWDGMGWDGGERGRERGEGRGSGEEVRREWWGKCLCGDIVLGGDIGEIMFSLFSFPLLPLLPPILSPHLQIKNPQKLQLSLASRTILSLFPLHPAWSSPQTNPCAHPNPTIPQNLILLNYHTTLQPINI